MTFLIVLAALVFLMWVAYRGHSVILFAPIAALGAVLLTDPSLVAPMFTGLFMDKMVGFLKLYFPVFLLGAVFGKLIETSGFSRAIVAATIRMVGAQRAMLSIVLVCALLTYGGVSLFVVVFAVYPFAAELFRQSDIPKRLIPGTIALGAFTFTMDALPGTPQIQNIIPTSFFGTTAWAAPWLGTLGGVFILIVGLTYLEWRRRSALKDGEGYGDAATLVNEPVAFVGGKLANPLVQGVAEVLMDEPDADAAYQARLQRLERAVGDMERLLDILFCVARRSELRWETVDADEFLSEAARLAARGMSRMARVHAAGTLHLPRKEALLLIGGAIRKIAQQPGAGEVSLFREGDGLLIEREDSGIADTDNTALRSDVGRGSALLDRLATHLGWRVSFETPLRTRLTWRKDP